MVAESKPILENERVKVSEIRIGPGERLPMHTHGRYINYVLTDATVRVIPKDGPSVERGFKKGFVAYSDDAGVTHSIENVGSTDALTLEIELKY
jgi:quercetin dioxygenase-like cupin family protein